MSDHTGIAWTDATWNPIRGCSRVSEGCRNCYAERIAARFSGPGGAYEGLARRRSNGEAQWTGEVRVIEGHMRDPLRWREPRRIFVNSMSDLFHEALHFEEIARVFSVMAASPHHTFQILTKRPERMRDFIGEVDIGMPYLRDEDDPTGGEWAWSTWPLPNVWLGVSVEHQAAADERIPLLLQTPAAVRFVSAEPLLGPVRFRQDWRDWLVGWDVEPVHVCGGIDDARCARQCPEAQQYQTEHLDWVIVGGESGTGYRPMDLSWLRSIVEQCKSADVPVFVKQDSEPLSGKQGRIPDELWIREFPKARVPA